MSFDRVFIGFFILAAVGAIIFGIANIGWAMECADKGGVYITGKSIWPVCLKAEVL